MLSALRSARVPSVLSGSLPSHTACTKTTPTAGVRFASGPRQPDTKQDPPSKSKSADTMSSFGEGYATRSDDEGFGGTHGGNQSACRDDEEECSSADEFDHSQGSEVKEKEKARHQNEITS